MSGILNFFNNESSEKRHYEIDIVYKTVYEKSINLILYSHGL